MLAVYESFCKSQAWAGSVIFCSVQAELVPLIKLALFRVGLMLGPTKSIERAKAASGFENNVQCGAGREVRVSIEVVTRTL